MQISVASPGAERCLRLLAGEIAAADFLRQYFAPFDGSGPMPWHFLGRVIPGLSAFASDQLKPRRLPSTVPSTSVAHYASLLELCCVLGQRAGLPARLQQEMLWLRSWYFDRRVSRGMQRDIDVIVGSYTSCMGTFMRARADGIKTLLHYPVAHHYFAQQLLQEEAKLEPDWASTLQFHQLDNWMNKRLDAEIEAADHILVLSSFQRRTFMEAGVDPSRMSVAHLGVDMAKFRPSVEPRAERPFRVLFVGQLTQRKGLSHLCRAFALADIPNSELRLVGRPVGTQAPWAEFKNVSHTPAVPHALLPRIYHDADVFVLPSLIEGFPQTGLEAMASGLPVIVSEHTFGDDVITDGVNGFVVSIRDPEAIAARLRELHDDPNLRRKMGRSARSTAETFTWKAYGDSVMKVIDSMLDGRGKTDPQE